MKKIIIAYVLTVMVLLPFHSCNKPSQEIGKDVLDLTFGENSTKMNTGEKYLIKFSTGETKVSSLSLTWTSSDEQVAIVTNAGEVNAVGPGRASIKAIYQSVEALCEVEVKDTNYDRPLNPKSLSQPFSDPMAYSIDVPLIAPFRVMQSFDFDKSGNIYYSQIGVAGGFEPGRTKAHEVYIIKSKPNLTGKTDYMTLKYFGHGGNIAIEEDDNGELYVWVGSNATKYASGEYWDEQSVSRIPYRSGQIHNGYAGESYFLNNGLLRIQAAVDRKSDLLCINATQGGERHFYTYKLSEAESLNPKNFTFSVKVGGEEVGGVEQIISRTVNGRDLSELTPLGSFSVPAGSNKAVDVNSFPFQGYDIDGSRHVYFFEGNWTETSGSVGQSQAYVTVFDLQGNIVYPRTRVAALSDINRLMQTGVTNSSGYMEAEGIKIRGNQLYLGFASYQETENYRRANIFKYDGARE